MKTLLQINSSLYADDGQSSRLASQFVDLWRAANRGARVLLRDHVARGRTYAGTSAVGEGSKRAALARAHSATERLLDVQRLAA
jgi:FMN-dependent NADH-azoreductase